MSRWKSNWVMWECNSPYKYRDDNLRALGFSSYRAYLASELWLSIRARVIARDGRRCQRCGRAARVLQVHHRAYDPATLRGDRIDAITTACERCHRKAERPRDYTRTSHDRLQAANHSLLRKPRKRAKALKKQLDRERSLVGRYASERGMAPRLVKNCGEA